MLPRVCLFLILASSAFADDLVWGGTWAGVWSGFGTSPYTAIDKSQSNKTILIFCLDYNDEIAPPGEWLANINPLNQNTTTNLAQFSGNYPNAKIIAATGPLNTPPTFAFQSDAGASGPGVNLAASPAAWDRYREAAWLFTNILDAQKNNDLNSMIISQVAAWDLLVEGGNLGDLSSRIAGTGGSYNFNNYEYSTNNYATAPGTQSITNLLFRDAVDAALTAAQTAVTAENWYGTTFAPTWDVVTGDPNWVNNSYGGTPVQEFLTPGPPPVPEPASVFLLFTVVACVAFAMRRKQRSAA